MDNASSGAAAATAHAAEQSPAAPAAAAPAAEAAEQAPAAAAPAAPAALPYPHWDEVVHFIVPYLRDQGDQRAVRLACKAWRASADLGWRAAAISGAAVAAGLPPSTAAFLLPRVQELCLVELQSGPQLAALAGWACAPGRAPALRSLVLSAPLGRRLPEVGALHSIRLPQLQRLATFGIHPMGNDLEAFTHLHQLTELRVSLASPAGGDGWMASLDGVARLTALPHLQALSLPELQRGEREALSRLTFLTRLSFTAAGTGAVGPSLRPLTRLAVLSLSLAHTLEHFIVLHPQLDWAALRQLRHLRHLRVRHLAANAFFAAPEVTWTDEAPAAHEADLLVAALPCIQRVELRLSYCRLPEEHLTPVGAPHELHLPGGTNGAHSRVFRRTVELAPVRQPGRRRPESWYAAWWQAPVQAQLATAGEAGAEAHQHFLAERGEAGGWAAIRPGNFRTFDVLVLYQQAAPGG